MQIRTLIVEDDPMVSDINKKFLEKTDSFKLVGIAKDGSEALRQLAVTPIDLLLLDVYMPHTNGLELLKKIRSEGYRCDVIMITAADAPNTVEDAFRLGVVDFIIKPYDYERFQTALYLFKKRFMMFRSSQSMDQHKIDALQLPKDKDESGFHPKGIDPITLELIRESILNSTVPLSAQEISDQVHLSRITTRKYLEFLVETEEIHLELKYSQQGRPTKLYRSSFSKMN